MRAPLRWVYAGRPVAGTMHELDDGARATLVLSSFALAKRTVAGSGQTPTDNASRYEPAAGISK
jgi:hypothetical protein